MRSSPRTSPWFLLGLPKPHPSLSWHTLRYAPGQVAAPEGLLCSAESAHGPSWPSSGTTGPCLHHGSPRIFPQPVLPSLSVQQRYSAVNSLRPPPPHSPPATLPKTSRVPCSCGGHLCHISSSFCKTSVTLMFLYLHAP